MLGARYLGVFHLMTHGPPSLVSTQRLARATETSNNEETSYGSEANVEGKRRSEGHNGHGRADRCDRAGDGGVVVTRDFGSSSATVKSPVHAAPNTVLRQDNPAHSSVEPAPGTALRQDDPAASKDAAAPADSQRGHRGGIQSI